MYLLTEGVSASIAANMLDCVFAVRKFELSSRYNVHFWLLHLGKIWTPFSLQLWVK